MKRGRIAGTAFSLVLILGTCIGCGVYSASSGRVDESIQRVAVRILENRTSEPNLGVDLTDAIIQSLQEDNTLKIVDESVADSIVYGEVVQYRQREVAARSDLTVNEYQIQISVKLSFEAVRTGEKLFDQRRFNGTGNYSLDADTETDETTAREEAAGEIVKDILAQVVEDW